MDSDAIRFWLESPQEGLDRELKSWIDPTVPTHRFSLVKGIMALWNHDGGMLAVGFDNETGNALPTDRDDWRAAYHVDIIQGLVSKHASQPFVVAVEWFRSGVAEHLVIVVASGVRAPVATKAPIRDPDSGRELLPVGTIYFRTLASNGTPSSAPARPEDWDKIVRLCFENREADIGRFLRRHLSPTSLPSIMAVLGLQQADETLRGRALALLDEGRGYFEQAIAEIARSPGHEQAVTWGHGEIALVISPMPRDGTASLDQTFLNTLYASAHSTRMASPPWHDGRTLPRKDTRPYTREGAYQMLLDVPNDYMGYFEFSRLDPKGRFYCRAAFDEETREHRFRPGSTPTLDPGNAVSRVVGAFLAGAAFARGRGADEDTTILGFALRWSGLKGRKLHNWNAGVFYPLGNHVARGDDVCTSFVELRLDTAPGAMAQYALQALAPLMTVFDWQMPPGVAQGFTSRTTGRS